jgi:hypothetical protein
MERMESVGLAVRASEVDTGTPDVPVYLDILAGRMRMSN